MSAYTQSIPSPSWPSDADFPSDDELWNYSDDGSEHDPLDPIWPGLEALIAIHEPPALNDDDDHTSYYDPSSDHVVDDGDDVTGDEEGEEEEEHGEGDVEQDTHEPFDVESGEHPLEYLDEGADISDNEESEEEVAGGEGDIEEHVHEPFHSQNGEYPLGYLDDFEISRLVEDGTAGDEGDEEDGSLEQREPVDEEDDDSYETASEHSEHVIFEGEVKENDNPVALGGLSPTDWEYVAPRYSSSGRRITPTARYMVSVERKGKAKNIQAAIVEEGEDDDDQEWEKAPKKGKSKGKGKASSAPSAGIARSTRSRKGDGVRLKAVLGESVQQATREPCPATRPTNRVPEANNDLSGSRPAQIILKVPNRKRKADNDPEDVLEDGPEGNMEEGSGDEDLDGGVQSAEADGPVRHVVCQWEGCRLHIPITNTKDSRKDVRTHLASHDGRLGGEGDSEDAEGSKKTRRATCKDTGLYRCLWHGCSVPPMALGSIVRHVTFTHCKVKCFCPICGKGLSRNDARKRHIKSQHQDPPDATARDGQPSEHDPLLEAIPPERETGRDALDERVAGPSRLSQPKRGSSRQSKRARRH
ncbi:hypothetical protein GLOTRDRAFT_132855 [Gloeophyllum trabeum ATCC 11539]|uniref:C2H2-type domain-containing protein n=1 Tax=Gloeophyllum trabeum (strain ATCC 11539 / FP-39264 / Madison 617) TaxID=670483 RepID=S7RBA2_GLOTA|nr:uncharacterized protein GLOTRDRAFT_132855 [Gloeophyllum trabeum ATCC 11539]EPQ51490.1 hypothetical protein GLOTRDRAFT_132855 [Gloeophyllum trabeum ATCC 11539]